MGKHIQIIIVTLSSLVYKYSVAFTVNNDIHTGTNAFRSCEYSSCLHLSSPSSTNTNTAVIDSDTVLKIVQEQSKEAKEWSEMFGFGGCPEEKFYELFRGIRDLQEKETNVLGLDGRPFVLSGGDDFKDFFTFDDLKIAVKEDFLDADRGSTDNKKGWKVSRVSVPRDSTFEGARMNLEQVEAAMEKGTIIFNAIGAHIPKLSGATLACCDATCLPNAVNLYVTAANQRTSAPPHTDRQDVVIVQSTGSKHWRVYSPPKSSLKPNADPFARGKGDDNLPLFALKDFGCELLLDVTLKPGDVLFVPAGFPHTTDTVTDAINSETSIHLTFNLDTHVWDLDYLSLRRFALKKVGVRDSALEQTLDEDNRYIGQVNLLPDELHTKIFQELPLGFLDDLETPDAIIEEVTQNLAKLSHEVDPSTAKAAEEVSNEVWKDTVARIRQQGLELLDIHRDMYIAAREEGDLRKNEAKMTEHLGDKPLPMTPERMQRLSLFRVQRYFEKINASKESTLNWTREGRKSESTKKGLPDNWAFTLPLNRGDKVEAEFGGAWFPATIINIGNTFDVEFFDGERESGFSRESIKLLTPPPVNDGTVINGVDTSQMTKKELKKFLKKQGISKK